MTRSDCFTDPYPELDGEAAFLHYESVRARFPSATFPKTFRSAGDLLELASQFEVLVFDAYGVLNVGGTAIPGSPKCIRRLRGLGKQLFVMTNGASYNKQGAVDKFTSFGYDFSAQEIVSSRTASENILERYVDDFVWGVMAKPNFDPDELRQKTIKLDDNEAVFDSVNGFLLLSTLDWNRERQIMLERSLEKKPRPVLVGNPDIVSPRETHFGLEPGYIGHRLQNLFGSKVEFHGKPFPSVYELLEERLGREVPPDRILMIGDTLHTDILGGASRGWQTVLVKDHGMFKGMNPAMFISKSEIVPNWVIGSI